MSDPLEAAERLGDVKLDRRRDVLARSLAAERSAERRLEARTASSTNLRRRLVDAERDQTGLGTTGGTIDTLQRHRAFVERLRVEAEAARTAVQRARQELAERKKATAKAKESLGMVHGQNEAIRRHRAREGKLRARRTEARRESH